MMLHVIYGLLMFPHHREGTGVSIETGHKSSFSLFNTLVNRLFLLKPETKDKMKWAHKQHLVPSSSDFSATLFWIPHLWVTKWWKLYSWSQKQSLWVLGARSKHGCWSHTISLVGPLIQPQTAQQVPEISVNSVQHLLNMFLNQRQINSERVTVWSYCDLIRQTCLENVCLTRINK